jgi:YD repeat-containing protein
LNSAWTTYSYDAKNRLIQDDTSGANAHNYTYSYDPNDNRLTSSETGAMTFWTYNPANRLVTAVSGGLTTSYSYDRNGNLTLVQEGGGAVYTMGYDNMLRLNYQIATSTYNTYTYDAGGLKRYEDASTGRTTVIWDGSSYLGSKI